MTFANEVIVDVVISNPALHIKKRAEDDIIKTIVEKVSEDADVKVNISVQAKEESKPLIKGNPMPGIQNMPHLACLSVSAAAFK